MPAWAALPAATAAASPFFNDYKTAAVHYSFSIHCSKSMSGIKSVAVQLDTVPSSLAVARLEEANLLARGDPNPHQLAAQVA
jgi:hypothetical protein